MNDRRACSWVIPGTLHYRLRATYQIEPVRFRNRGKSKVTRPHAGRPPHVPTDESRTLVESLSGFGIPQTEIARLVGIDPKMLRHQINH